MKLKITAIVFLLCALTFTACNDGGSGNSEDIAARTAEMSAAEGSLNEQGALDERAEDNDEDNEPKPFNDITAAELVAAVRIGWNLGNTLDAYGGNPEDSVSVLERLWVNRVTTKENIDALKAAGFNAIRIPVTWFKVCDDDYNIRADWMERVREVVGYAVDNDMYIILNTHHEEAIFKFTDADMAETQRAFTKVWGQIADTFKNYDEKLVFESLNEPRTVGSLMEWEGGTPEEHNNINALNQLFVDLVRASGGNNDKRVLLIPTYAASASETAQSALVMPSDSAKDKIAVSIHMYSPYGFALANGDEAVSEWYKNNPEDTSPITEPIDLAESLFISNGIPVILGEFGAMNRGNTDYRAEWAEFYVSYAKLKGIACFWWDNAQSGLPVQNDWGWSETFGILDRLTNVFTTPEVVEALMKGSFDN
ncbi:MAG: glycoside hydrolase family 5 protein [Oscillospiraceae bacterium]|nr:glycoside hydrolase family 5 protein [Oscillospiraceae bacterium]